ncbi:hypothetical protein Esti_004476 [Eimeria stiedai]
MLLLRRWRGPRIPSGATVESHRCGIREVSVVNTARARGGGRGPRGAPCGTPSLGPFRRGRTAAEGNRDRRNFALHGQVTSDKVLTDPASRGLHPRERFPRPDLDLEALREEQRNAQGASQWQVVTTTTKADFERPGGTVSFARSGSFPSDTALRSAAPGYPVSSDEAKNSRLSAGEQLEKIRAARRAQRPPAPCIYDGVTGLTYDGGLTAISAEHQRSSEENPSGCSSAGATDTFFSEGPTDWRLEITEDFDDNWARLSGVTWDGDAGGPPWGPPANRLEDKRLKVFVPELGGAPKPVAALNRFQVLGVLENPSRALGLSGDHKKAQAAFSSSTLPPEVYEALVERLVKILPSFDRQQLQKLLLLQQQHVHALQQQYLLLLHKARTLRLQSAVTAQQQQPQHRQLATAEAVESEAAADVVKRCLKALQQQLLLDQQFDALLPHLAHMSLEELGCVSRAFVVSIPKKSFGLLQVLVLHALDKVAAYQWAALPEGPSKPRGLARKALMVLQPLVVGSLRVVAAGAAHCHRSPEAAHSSSVEIEGPLAGTGAAPEETGGALGFACRRLLEAISQDSELQELQFLPRGLLLQLLLCCCSVGSGASSAAYKVAKQCIDLLLEGPHGERVSYEGALGGAAFSEPKELKLEGAIRILISCSYLETRGGPPTWQLPLFKELLGAFPSGYEGLHEREGPLRLCIKSNEAIFGPSLLPRCSPGFVCSGSHPTALLSNQQIETLIGMIEKALPSRGFLEDGFSGFPLLRRDKQQLMQGPAADSWRSFPESLADETVDLEGGLEEWAIRVKVRLPREPSSEAPFDYLDDEDEGGQAQVTEAAMPAAVALAATEAVAWALSRLLQQQQQHQAEREQQQQALQQQRLQESKRKTLSLLVLLASRLAASTEDPRVSPLALIQGAHALVDAVENLLSALEAPCHQNILQAREFRVAILALLQAEAFLLLTAAARAAHEGHVPHGFMKASIEAVCCCISRSLGALLVLRPPAYSQKSLDGDAERAAVAAFVTAAKDCLRCCRPTTWLDETQQTSNERLIIFPLKVQAQWLRSWGALLNWCLQEQSYNGSEAIQLKEISEETAYALVSAGKLLQAERAPQTIVEALDAFLTCAQPLLDKNLSASNGILAVAPKAGASATTGLERMLTQLSRLSPLVSEGELRCAAGISRRLLHLQQELVQKMDSQAVSLSLAKGSCEVLRDAIEAVDTSLLERLIRGRHGERRQNAPQSQLKMKQTPGTRKRGGS